MIARIHGRLVGIEDGAALIHLPAASGDEEAGLTYSVLVTTYTAARLGGSIGRSVTLHTLTYIDGAQGATMYPRLAGFATVEDRDFFELFTTCKGIGNRKALRAMALSTAQIAAAIADRDVTLLKSLPEIGKRTAETVIATLHGKVEPYMDASSYRAPGADGESPAAAGSGRGQGTSVAREAIEVLLQFGESRTQVVAWVDQAMRGDDAPSDVQGVIARVYQIKAGG